MHASSSPHCYVHVVTRNSANSPITGFQCGYSTARDESNLYRPGLCARTHHTQNDGFRLTDEESLQSKGIIPVPFDGCWM